MRTDSATVQQAYEALKAAQQWLTRFEEHAPIQFGGEAEVGQQIDAALLALEGTKPHPTYCHCDQCAREYYEMTGEVK